MGIADSPERQIELLGRQAGFAAMVDGTPDEWRVVDAHTQAHHVGLAARVVDHLRLLAGDTGGFAVDRLEHSLQTATRAHRAGKDDTYVVCALLHDLGDVLASRNHAELAATVLRPFVSDDLRWMVEHHGVFQGYHYFHHFGLDRDLRDQWRDHPAYDLTVEFCDEFDQASFDPTYRSLPVDEFVPAVETLFSTPRPDHAPF